MDINKAAIVTAIFNIGRDKWDNFTMSYHTYIWWMRSLLYMDSNLIIYTEEEFFDLIVEFRKEVDPNLEKTVIILQPLNEIEGYKLFAEPLMLLMESESFKNKVQFNVPEMTKPLYNVVMFAKMFYIKHAFDNKIFDADMYIWADAAVLREDHPSKNRVFPNLSKINQLNNNKPTFFCHHDYVKVEDKEFHALSQTRFIQGGSFFIPVGCVEELCSLFEKVVFESIEAGYIGSDEKMFDFIYIQNPDKYNLIQCGWREYIDLFT